MLKSLINAFNRSQNLCCCRDMKKISNEFHPGAPTLIIFLVIVFAGMSLKLAQLFEVSESMSILAIPSNRGQ